MKLLTMKNRHKTKALSRIDKEVRPVLFSSGVLLLLQSYFLFAIDFSDKFSLSGPLIKTPAITFGENIAWTIQVDYFIAFYLFVAAIMVLLQSTLFYEKYRKQVIDEHNKFRWLEYLLTAPLMVSIVALLIGVNDLLSLFVIYLLTTSVIYLGDRIERALTRNNKEEAVVQYALAFILQIVALAVIAVSLFSSEPALLSKASQIILYSGLVLLLSFFPFISWFWIKKYRVWKKYITVEFSYIIASFLAKTGLAALAGVTLLLY